MHTYIQAVQMSACPGHHPLLFNLRMLINKSGSLQVSVNACVCKMASRSLTADLGSDSLIQAPEGRIRTALAWREGGTCTCALSLVAYSRNWLQGAHLYRRGE